MNTVVAKQTIKQCFQPLHDELLQNYHLTHDYYNGRPLAVPQIPRPCESTMDAEEQKKQRDLNALNAILHPKPTLGHALGSPLAALRQQLHNKPPSDTSFTKPSADLLNRAKNWFDNYQTHGLEALLTEQSRQLTEANIMVIKKAFSHNSILTQNACILSAFWIRSPLDWEAKSGVGLFEHLFVRYKAPAFLKACWSQTIDEKSVRWLLCFIMYAQGGSLKNLAKHFGWAPVSHKLWHQLFLCPANLSPLDAVLHAEFKRLGGWDADLECLMNNVSYVIDLLEPASENGLDFWYDTCRWTIKQQFELTSEENSKVLWWVRHQLTEYARCGETYRLQGRSKSKVMESIATYEQEQLQLQRARERMAERARQVSMARIAERERLREADQAEPEARDRFLAQLNGDYLDEPLDASWNSQIGNWSTRVYRKNWRFIELTTSQELYEEGEAMEHCVGSYTPNCMEGSSAIFSLRCNGSRKATIEIDPLCKQLIQVQGYCNAEPAKSVMSVVNTWMKGVVEQ